ncbi:MAG: right-handed parallel beta-helix repeat-containing protein [Planctomycetes bacterium]|nr:right-handed parallel beta-helix repeat-containing protein [Planctomycetota bacterium]
MTKTKKLFAVAAASLAVGVAALAWAPLESLADPARDAPRAERAAAEGVHFFRMLEEGRSLDRPFPEKVGAEEELDLNLYELGNMLFFDPILSGDNETSCAHCHHPNLGFADGRETAMGFGGEGVGPEREGGVPLGRNTPTLWNAVYSHRQFWDGRAADLAEQAAGPITDPKEMGQDPEELVEELSAIPEYVSLFERVFGEGGLSFENVTRAIAAFEEQLTSQDSRFDRYARGDREALNDSERRGLAVFRSLKTRCFECHNLPTFANPEFKVIGVPPREGGEPDLGRGAIAGEAYNHAFKVPTLRNIELTAPYMHNGSLETLEDVVDFYADGGGRGRGFDIPQIDDKIRRFDLSWSERQDLVAFLRALTDESRLPVPPIGLLSGLEPVAYSGPASPLTPAGPPSTAAAGEARAPMTHTVRPGESIQAAVDAAEPGDTIEVHAGVYSETVLFDVDEVTLRGVPDGDERPLLDGLGELSDAIIGSGRGLTIEGFDLANFTANGVMLNLSQELTMRDLRAYNTGLYGLYPVESIGVLVERCEVTGARDAGIYVGQCKDVVVRDCVATGNVTGIEIENCVDALVEGNHVSDNAGGLLVFLLPNNPSKVSIGCLLRDNVVTENNHVNFADEGAMVGNVPSGTGVLILGADDVEVTSNVISGNKTCGVAVLSLSNLIQKRKAGGIDVDPWPDRVWVHDNELDGNGLDPDQQALDLGLPGCDLLWDVSGEGNSWSEAEGTTTPPLLPSPEWGEGKRRLFRRAWRAAGA